MNNDGELDEKYQGGLWDWAGDLVHDVGDETLQEDLQLQIYYAMQEIFDALYKGKQSWVSMRNILTVENQVNLS